MNTNNDETREAKWNPETKTGTYSHAIRHGEVGPGYQEKIPGSHEKQNLAQEQGINGALKSLQGRRRRA